MNEPGPLPHAATAAPGGGSGLWLWRALAVLLALPSLLYLIGARGEAWYLIVPGFCLAGLIGRGNDTRVLAVALAASLPLPIVPVLFQVAPFELERVVLHGALAVLAWRGALCARRNPAAGGGELGGRGFRILLAAWLAWSAGSALRGWMANTPVGVDGAWLRHVGLVTAERLVASTSLVESTRPLSVLLLRFDTLLTAWAACVLARRDANARRAVVECLAWTVPLAVLLSGFEMWRASTWRGEDFLARMALGLPRSHRPLADHNSLASAMVLIFPVLVGAAWMALRGSGPAAWRRGMPRWLLPTAALCAGLLLFSSRSKSGYGGVAVAFAIAGLMLSGGLGSGARRALRLVILVPLAAVLLTNLMPEPVRQKIGTTRRGEDYLDLVHYKRLGAYFRKNRTTVWSTGEDLVASAPLLGVGLGNFPRKLAEHHDPARAGFNPLHENAHNQYLQWWGEEGVVGLLLGVAVFLFAIVAGFRSLRGPPVGAGEDGVRDDTLMWTAAACGLAVNLVAGHALLVPTVAILWAGGLGLLAAAAPDGARVRGPARVRVACAALFASAWLPAFFADRAPLASFESGLQPWVLYPGETPDRVRVLTADARWHQVWGSGGRMLLGLDDPRPTGLSSPPEWVAPQLVSVALNGEWVVLDQSLESTREAGAAPLFLKLDRPAGVTSGELVEVRVRCSVEFEGTQIFGKGREQVAARMLPVVFVPGR